MGKTDKPGSVVSCVCEICGQMQCDSKYYDKDGNAATNFIVCKKCQRKQQKKKNGSNN